MTFYSNGKLLLTGEYFVLNGSKSIALPCKKGQLLKVEPNIENNSILWETWDFNKKLIMTASFNNNSLDFIEGSIKKSNLNQLRKILLYLKKKSPNCFNYPIKFITNLEFDINWGLGSSSTLINNLSQWAKIDPYELLENTFGGSGYDIACAQSKTPIIFQKINNSKKIEIINFKPVFHNKLFFVYLNRKQSSKLEIEKYYNLIKPNSTLINKISEISRKIILVKTQEEFNELINEHEKILSKHLGVLSIKKKLFNTFNGEIKSLGAWGGDFILVSGLNGDIKQYFHDLGYKTIIKYSDMVI
tara:strand:- start:837 stop:1742 length:906 start_codon:yes stop_codon:yes gene_type:complete